MKLTTAGESHGKGLFAIIEGMPAGLELNLAAIDDALSRRQSGYGRGARQKLERDRAEILSGVRNRMTTGSPIALAVSNRDYENWEADMAPEGCGYGRALTKVRPGHADLAGCLKFRKTDAREILERASARETAVRVAAGEIFRQYLAKLGIEITGYVRSVGSVSDENEYTFEEICARDGELGMLDARLAERAKREIDRVKAVGDTLGGRVELRVKGLKPGFGSCMTYREKLDARLAAAIMSVQAIKGVEIGIGFRAAQLRGSAAHDEIIFDGRRYAHMTNHAGGIEGGMSNGEEIVLRAAMKPIPTLTRGLKSVDLATGEAACAAAERSDVCAILAAEVVAEGALAAELAEVVSERLGGDTMGEVCARYEELPL